MVMPMRDVVRKARQERGPVIQKWEDIERYALPLLLVSAFVIGALAVAGNLHEGLALSGVLTGLLVVGAYAAAIAARMLPALVLAVLVALAGAVSAAVHSALPLWMSLSNGLGGLVFVLALIASWTKRL